MARSSVVTVIAASKIATSVSISVVPTSGIPPFTVSISGRIIDAGGTPLGGKSINLYSNGTLVGSIITGQQGIYDFGVNITTAGTYQFQTEFLGDVAYEGCTVHNGTHGLGEAQLPWLAVGIVVIGVGAGLYFLLKH